MGRQWERQLLLPFSFYIDAKVLLFFELAKFNLECEPHGRLWDRWDEWEGWEGWETGETSGTSETSGTGERIIRLSFAHCSLIIYSFYIVLFVFFNFYIF